MGELSEDVIRANMPEYLPGQQNVVAVPTISGGGVSNMVAPISGNSLGLVRAQVSHGVRQVVLCKDKDGKIGLKAKAVNKGVFVCLVARGSPAALGGLRFGDQILQINGENVAGFGENKASLTTLIQLYQEIIPFLNSQNCRSTTSSRGPR